MEAANQFHRLLVEHTKLVSLGPGGSFAQFRRLACSLSSELHERALPTLERVELPAEVPARETGTLAAEIRTGLSSIAEVATDGWVLDGQVERRFLALHPDGVAVHLLRSGSVRVRPDHGPVIRHGGRDYRLDGIAHGHVRYTQVAGERHEPSRALLDQVVAALGPDLAVRSCPATHVFAGAVRRFIRLLDEAGRSGETVVVFDADPRSVGLL